MSRYRQPISVHTLFWVLCAICLTSVGCSDSSPMYEQFRAIPGQKWHYHYRPTFRVYVQDSSQKYDLNVLLRHNNTYKYSNLALLLHEEKGFKSKAISIPNISLADADGRWFSKTSGGLYNVKIPAIQSYVFSDTGVYVFSIEQVMSESPLIGISDLGLKIVASQ